MEIPWENLSDPIFEHARKRPDAPAVIEGPEVVSYARFAALIAAAGMRLKTEHGIGEDDRIGVALTNSIEHLAIHFALLRIGATPVEIAPDADTELFSALSSALGLRMILAESTAPVVPKLVRIGPLWREQLRPGPGFRSQRPGDQNKTLLLTSGSTGTPKAVILSHRQRLARAMRSTANMYSRWSAGTPGRFLLSASMSNGGFLTYLLNQTVLGGPIVLAPIFANIVELARMIRSQDDIVTVVTPNMCRAFLDAATGPGPLFPRIRLLVSTGLPLYGSEKQAMLARVSPHFVETYGAIGVGGISLLEPGAMARKADTVGRPAPGLALEIVDEAGHALPAGAIGRIRCRYPGPVSGPAPEEGLVRGEGFADGWYHPGDLGRLDEDGFLQLKGRVSDVIRQNGVELLPAEIEEAIAAMPQVAEAIVVGRPAADGKGEEAVAFVVTDGSPLAAADFDAHCKAHLAPGRRPAHIYFARNVPRTANGKIDRQAVRAAVLQKAQG